MISTIGFRVPSTFFKRGVGLGCELRTVFGRSHIFSLCLLVYPIFFRIKGTAKGSSRHCLRPTDSPPKQSASMLGPAVGQRIQCTFGGRIQTDFLTKKSYEHFSRGSSMLRAWSICMVCLFVCLSCMVGHMVAWLGCMERRTKEEREEGEDGRLMYYTSRDEMYYWNFVDTLGFFSNDVVHVMMERW